MTQARSVLTRIPLIPVASILAGAIAWEIAGEMDVSFALPPLSTVFKTMWEMWQTDRFQQSLEQTLKVLAFAYPLSVFLGIVLGFLAGRYRVIEWALDIHINIFMSLPLTALIPIIFLLFGLDNTSLYIIIVLFTFFVVLVNTSAGVKAIDYQYEEMARSFGASEFQIIRRIVIPGSLPLMLTGIRIGTGRSIKGVIVAEQIMGFMGLGGLVSSYGRSFRIEETWAVILTIGIVGLLMIEAFRLLEHYLLKIAPQGNVGE